MATVKRILVPTDFGEAAEHALGYALDLAATLGASVTIMHAYEIPVVGFPDGALVATAEVATRIRDVAREALLAAERRAQGRGVEVDSVLREGVAWQEINAVAEEVGADLIVVGTHARSGIARALLGSVAETVVRHTELPVLTVHLPHHEKAA